ncbi:hypothetical protein [Intestinimonas butyriciproducens]|uniref:hypothetical protein n=1 Tax=Intestinimonas butyriciproducens TaxID=1297617 RepID=UPI001959FC42|nr:hypothetical protein [Intestinimonas butyriciproducens]MBM6917501.1 hypothetical protein [Intestinimonas butyriciproducens]
MAEEKQANTQSTLYQTLGTLTDTLYLTAQVVSRPGEKELLLSNRVPHGEETRAFFSQLYAAFTRREERSDFVDLFSAGQDFYAIFRYYEGRSLAESFRDCPGNTEKRLGILIRALFRVHTGGAGLPESVQCALLQPENILLDQEENVRLLYQFHPEFFTGNVGCSRWKETAALMEFMLRRELKNPYHKALRDICKMCEAGLYDGLPPLIRDLEKARDGLGQNGLIPRAKAFFQENKRRLAQVSWLGMVVLFFCLVVYFITSLTGGEEAAGEPITQIGLVSYGEGQEEEGSIQLQDPTRPPEEEKVAFASLPEPEELLTSEDYIVAPGDTWDSICESYYGAAGYAPAAASYNGLDTGREPQAGTVLRLPMKDQLAQYLED